MEYSSVDQLQKLLTEEVFHYAKDAKKAAGRALGTFVEIITFYYLKSWGLERYIAIERPLPEYANADLTHNVEYSLHPAASKKLIAFTDYDLPLTAKKITNHKKLMALNISKDSIKKSKALLSKDLILRNACTICDLNDHFLNTYLVDYSKCIARCAIFTLHRKPFAIFECKRVDVEEGVKKGPQTIEKAKQGAYVARAVSSLQKMRYADGRLGGLIEKKDGTFCLQEYHSLLAKVIASNDSELLADFILTIGVLSNHGNWFTSENHNKELKVLAQSYDWLLFLTDDGIAQFIDDLLLHPKKKFSPVRNAFFASYTGEKGVNRFTKVKVALSADAALQSYFKMQSQTIEGWFNVIAPAQKNLARLRSELKTLKNKNWQEIHS